MTTTPYTIPLTNSQQQITISLGGVVYTLTVWFDSNPAANCWVMDIGNQNNVPILTGIPLVTGTDLLGQFAYLNFGGKLICQTDFDPDAIPTYQNLGYNSQLYFVVED
jgi:hypothetical protein